MGTHGVVGVVKNGQTKATYNHFDSYPEGMGVTVLKDVKNCDLEKARENFDKIKLIEDDEDTPPKELLKLYSEYGNPGVRGLSTNTEIKNWYQLLRKAQGTLKPFLNGTITHMIDSAYFAKSPSCEWAYIVNLDTEKFEVWSYHKLIKQYDLHDLPSGEAFLRDLGR